MYGVVTRTDEELDWPEFDRGVYEVENAAGRSVEPVAAGASAVSCFGDTATVEASPSAVQVDGEGTTATPDRTRFDWSSVCPNESAYREGLLETIADAAGTSGDVRLDDVGFPGAGFCRCDRCEAAFEASEHDDWRDWRASVVGEFVGEARERVPGRLSLSVHPDPYPGHLRHRGGIDLAAVAADVDEFVVPLYGTYETTYWVESLAWGFADAVADLDAELGIELYAADVELSALEAATEIAEAHADTVYFGYGADSARAILRRRRAAANEGVEHGP